MTGADGYKVYTRRYDQTVRASQLSDVLGQIPSKYQSSYDEVWDQFQHGLAGWRTKLEIAAIGACKSLSEKTSLHQRQDTVVSFLVDHSGSMRGQRILLSAATVTVLTEALVSMGIKVEILGFTTVSWRGGHPRKRWRWFRSYRPGRLCELLHIIYRDASDPNPGVSVREMLRADLPKENVDGEAIEWAATRLVARPEKRKVLVVLSDGAPVDDSTLAANDLEFLSQHLKVVVTSLENKQGFSIGAVDICGGHAKDYFSTVEAINVPDELGEKTLNMVCKLLLS